MSYAYNEWYHDCCRKIPKKYFTNKALDYFCSKVCQNVLKICVTGVFYWLYFVIGNMGKFMKPGKVVLVLGGRYAGRKAIIVKVCSNMYDINKCAKYFLIA